MSRRRVVVVVSEAADAAALANCHAITADEYLEGAEELHDRKITVVNLCRSYRYRSKGYYVSLLADARGQRVLPTVATIQGLSEPFRLARSLREAGVPVLDEVAADPADGSEVPPAAPTAEADAVAVSAYFGACADPRFRGVAGTVYRCWPAPVLRLHFLREDEEWKLARVAPAALHQLAAEERAALCEALSDERRVLRRGTLARPEETHAAVAVLFDEEDCFSPSTPETIDRLERVAARMHVHVHRIGLDDLEHLGEYDALLIRALTGVREPSFQFAVRAEALGMPVVDDTQSIIRCSNKVFLDELLRREGLPTPRTVVVTGNTPWAQVAELGLPLVVKLPDSAFSAAVHKVASRKEFEHRAEEMFQQSPMLIAQEYLPTEFDWRIGVLDGRLLFAARYFMARGHWQIRAEQQGTARYGRVEAVPRDEAPAEVVELALRTAALIGRGLYGVDIKETPGGPVVIEINDNPNLDVGYEDAEDGALVYEDIVNFFLRRLEDAGAAAEPGPAAEDEAALRSLRTPIRQNTAAARNHYRPFEVAGMELEYAVVDRDLNAVSLVEPAFRVLAGRYTSDVDLGAVGFSNEIADHVFELKTIAPVASLAAAEEALVEGVQRFSAVLRDEWDARLLPTGMHPWLNPRKARLWARSNARIYNAYARLFDVGTHGWMNVHAAHLNLPLGREQEGVAMYNAAALLIPYLPALAASSPMFDGELQPAVDNRLAWIIQHQARIPESCGDIVPETVEHFKGYRKQILGPMYAALDRLPDAGVLRHEFFNARGAVLKFSRKAMEIRVLDMQECVKLDVAVAVFVRSALRALAQQVATGETALPEHGVLVEDFRACVRDGSRARVHAPHLGEHVDRDEHGNTPVRAVLRELLALARRAVRKDEAAYLDQVEQMIDTGTLSERIRDALLPYADRDEEFTEVARRIYIELSECLVANEPWRGRTAVLSA